jgi:hypothetical protein
VNIGAILKTASIALEVVSKWAPVVELLISSGFDPDEALTELREWELLKRKERDVRMGRGTPDPEAG